VADLIIDRCTDGFWETMVIQRGRDGLLFIDVLANTKNLLLSSVNFLNNYRKYA